MACKEVTQYGEVQGEAVRGGQQVGLQVINVIIDSVTCIFYFVNRNLVHYQFYKNTPSITLQIS